MEGPQGCHKTNHGGGRERRDDFGAGQAIRRLAARPAGGADKAHAEAASILDAAVEVAYDVTVTLYGDDLPKTDGSRASATPTSF